VLAPDPERAPWQDVKPHAPAGDIGHGYFFFKGVPEGTRQFDAIEGVVKVTCRISESVLRLDDILAKGEGSISAGGITLTLRKVLKRDKGTAWLAMTVKREGRDAENLLKEESANAAFALIDPEGVSHPGVVAGDPFTKKTGRRAAPGADEAVQEPEFEVRFWELPDAEGPWSLVLTWPERVDTREYPFTIKDVPLP
jgi:hypothetical protein